MSHIDHCRVRCGNAWVVANGIAVCVECLHGGGSGRVSDSVPGESSAVRTVSRALAVCMVS